MLTAFAAGLAALLVQPFAPAPDAARRAPVGVPPGQEAALRRFRIPLVGLAGVGGWVVLGGWFGLAAGVVAGLAGWRVLQQVESPAAAERRALLERDLPMAVYLLGAALAAGAPPAGALHDVADACGGPIAEEFRITRHRLQLGVDPTDAWRALDGPLRPLGRAMARAHGSGASVRTSVEQLADDLRAEARVRAEARARGIEVRTSVPLGVCFLPAFVVLGVVPMAVGIFSTLRLFG